MAIQRRLVEAVEVTENRVHVIRLKDIFDASTVSEFEKVVSYLLSRNFYKVVVDLGHVEFISSAGWGAFTAELRRARENQGDVKLANMSPDVYDVFLLLELDSFIQSFDSVDEALAAFSQPVVAPEPGPVRSSILQEIKAASHAREMAEAGARAAAEKPAPDFSERWRERTVAGSETYAPVYAAPASEKAMFAGVPRDHEHMDTRIEHTVASAASAFDTASTFRAPSDAKRAGGPFEFGDSPHLFHGQYGTAEQTEYTGDDYASATGHENFSVESDDEAGTNGQADDAGDGDATEGEYENYSAASDNESGVTEQAEYAGGGDATEGEYENYSAESDDESGVTEQAEYAGDDAGEGEYESSSAESDGESGAAEQAEYAGDDASEGEYESYSAESDGETGVAEQTEYAGDDDVGEGEYESSSAESDGESGVAEQAEYAGDDDASDGEYESSSAESDGESGVAGQAEYAGDDASEGEYESSSVEPDNENGVAEQAEYAGNDDAAEGEYENYSAESDRASGVTEQGEYAGDVYADETEYEDDSAEYDSEDGVIEQAEYAGDDDAGEGEYESSSAESDGESGAAEQAEYAGDDDASDGEYESYSAESDVESGVAEQAEYAGDDDASEGEYENYSAESDDETDVAEQGEYAGDVYADETEYEDSSVESFDEDGAAEQAEYAGDEYASESEYSTESDGGYGAIEDESRDVNARNEYAIADETDESGPVHAKLPAANDPEMWELILAGGRVPVDPDMFKKSPRLLPEAEKPQEPFASGATPPVSDQPSAEDSSSGSSGESSAPDASLNADNAFEEFETQDIRDPWILDEIDTLPEEYEMEGGAADGAEPSFSASELLSYDLELDASFSPLPEPVRDDDKVETAGESATQFEALPQAGIDDYLGNLRDLLMRHGAGEAQAGPGFAPQADAHVMRPHDDLQRDFPAPSVRDENLAAPGDDLLEPPAKSAKKKATRIKKSKPQRKRAKPSRSSQDEENFLAPPALDEHGELIDRASQPASRSSPNGNDEASHNHPPDEALPKIPASGNLGEIVRAVVATHPEFGAAMICKFIEDHFEPPVFISQSTVYRFLREADLNTRAKRQAYANQLFDPSVIAEAI